MLQYSTLHALVAASPKLQVLLPHLPAGFGEPLSFILHHLLYYLESPLSQSSLRQARQVQRNICSLR